MNATLPNKNEDGYYEIRMESIGGMGANLAGKMLAEALVTGQGLNALAFAAYGSEKKGSPVKSYIRISDSPDPIRINAPVMHPSLLVVFHPDIARGLPVMNGVKKGASVLLNARMSPDEARDFLKFPGGVIGCVDATKITVEEKVKLNTVILGAVARMSGFISPDVLKAQIRSTFEKKYPHLVEPNIRAFERGFNEVEIKEFPSDDKYEEVPYVRDSRKIGWANSLIGGAIDAIANTLEKDMSTSRSGFIPVWHPEKCIHCAECEMTCPDMCFIWEEGKDDKGNPQMFLKGINYRYCKGCQRCVAVCKHGALTTEVEADVDMSSLGYLTGLQE